MLERLWQSGRVAAHGMNRFCVIRDLDQFSVSSGIYIAPLAVVFDREQAVAVVAGAPTKEVLAAALPDELPTATPSAMYVAREMSEVKMLRPAIPPREQ